MGYFSPHSWFSVPENKVNTFLQKRSLQKRRYIFAFFRQACFERGALDPNAQEEKARKKRCARTQKRKLGNLETGLNWKPQKNPKGCRLLQLSKMPILRISVKNIGNFFTKYLPSEKSDSFVSLLSDIYSSFQRFAATALKPKKFWRKVRHSSMKNLVYR